MRASGSRGERVATVTVVHIESGRAHTTISTTATMRPMSTTAAAATTTITGHTTPTLLQIVIVEVERQPMVLELQPNERRQNEANEEHEQRGHLKSQIALLGRRRET